MISEPDAEPDAAPVAAASAWSRPADEVASELQVDPAEGLSPRQVSRRRREYGENRLREPEHPGAAEILVRQFRSLIIALLVVAAVVSAFFGQLLEAAAIVIVIVLNALVGFVAELRAVRSMEALRALGSVRCRVRRRGRDAEITAEELVPGDIVLVEGGDVVTADLRLVEASGLQADESVLTGESVPVGKSSEAVAGDAALADRASMLFKGTAVTRGSAVGVVVGTGMRTELGRIAELVETAEEEVTPLERRLERLGHRLVWVTVGIAAVATGAGIFAGRPVLLMVETGIALAVAAIPEGLPIVATIALARGMLRLARRNALIKRLSAVETLGATTVILTDKTGTLTENRMTARLLSLPGADVEIGGDGLRPEGRLCVAGEPVSGDTAELAREALRVGVLCSNARLPGDEDAGIGDPMEVALLVAGAKAGLDRDDLLAECPEEREEAFDPATKMMATFHDCGGELLVAVKGAAEEVLKASSRVAGADGEEELDEDGRRRWLERNGALAGEGMRVLALASRVGAGAGDDPYRDLVFRGLVGLLDPPRRQTRGALRDCVSAGIRVVMVTGDQPATARNIARAVGLVDEEAEVRAGADVGNPEQLSAAERQALLDVPVFARVDPRQKLALISLHQEAGAVVAMTGDGVNDAPALKKADIGVAMGQRGTQVAQDAADMVLTDDAFSSIVAAVRQGRVIFGNIRKFVLYLLSCNVSEIMVVSAAAVLDIPLPVLPLQILFLNLVTDVFPALALALGEGDHLVMDRPPRDPGEAILSARHWGRIAGLAALMTSSVLGALVWARYGLGLDRRQAVTVSFATLALTQLWNVFNMRDRGSSLLGNDVVRNPWIWGALALCAGLVAGAVYVPVVSDVLRTAGPGPGGWAVVLGMSLVPWVLGQAWHALGPGADAS